jgi:hypothetical protein
MQSIQNGLREKTIRKPTADRKSRDCFLEFGAMVLVLYNERKINMVSGNRAKGKM